MADYSARTPNLPSSSSADRGIQRPAMKRVRHTWHGETVYLSHFEDFMREIGVDARQHHLCCLPRQATVYTRGRSRSLSILSSSRGGELFASPAEITRHPDGSELSPNTPGRFPTRGPSSGLQSTSAHHPLARTSVASSSKTPKPPGHLKAQAAISVYTQTHGASSQCPTVPASRGLRFLIGDSMVSKTSQNTRAPGLSGTPADQEPWTRLPNAPGLVAAPVSRPPEEAAPTASPPSTRSRSVSRVPSFASLRTVSSSEGPETPRGQSPLRPSLPVHARELSPTLSYLEHVSKIRVPALCVVCQKAGHNFPSCSACGDTWCSRECRVKGNGGRGTRHVCQKVVEAPMIRAGIRGRHIA